MAKTCRDLKEMFELAYSEKQTKLVHHFCLNEGMLLKCSIDKMEMERIQIVVAKCLRQRMNLIGLHTSGQRKHLIV